MEAERSKNVPNEAAHPNAYTEYHDQYRENGDLREPYRIANNFLVGTQKVPLIKCPEAPTIVFINSRSGGRAGPDLAISLRHALGYSQVVDLDGENRPDVVLDVLCKNLEAANSELARGTRERLRIVAAGGDGTVAWILQAIKKLQLQPAPAVSVIPLGTGNDLARQFGWSGSFQSKWIKDHKSIYETLKRVADAVPEQLDCWKVTMTAPDDSFFDKQLPHAFAHDASDPKQFSRTAYSWNYVSIGMDAKAAYGFHHLRNTSPGLTFSRSINQFWYGWFGCKSGWFCCSKDLQAQVSDLEVLNEAGVWKQVPISPSVKAVVILNLQSYGGGRNLWGRKKEDEFKEARKDDGLLEVVGLCSGWDTGLVMAGLKGGTRIAQSHGVKFKVRGWRSTGDATSKVHLQLDGEPWRQTIPNKAESGQDYLQVEITYANTSRVLHYYPENSKDKAPKTDDAPYTFQLHKPNNAEDLERAESYRFYRPPESEPDSSVPAETVEVSSPSPLPTLTDTTPQDIQDPLNRQN